MLHHGTPFAAVRWTNIYDKAEYILLGDTISGPVRPNFGPGVVDVRVTMRRGPGSRLPARLFTHGLYWTDTGKDSPQLGELRAALDLVFRS